MPTDSRVKKGKLTFTVDDGSGSGTAVDFSCQPTAVALTPNTDEGDSVEVLCGDSLTTGGTTSWTLDVTSVQDFDDPDGFVLWALANDGASADFEWLPNDTGDCPTFTGTVTVRPMAIGGDVATQNTSDISWPITSGPVATPPAPAAAPTSTASKTTTTTSGS
jgi:hypothetical protein